MGINGVCCYGPYNPLPMIYNMDRFLPAIRAWNLCTPRH